ncbi:MAG TPA: hypothetical protein VF829_02030 [Candidatus Paceibacterota bacterium]
MRRALIGILGAAIVITIGIVLSSSRLSDGIRKALSDEATTTVPVSIASLTDSYRRGTHTVSGALVLPNACYTFDASASLAPSTTPQVIRVDISVPPDSGRCLALPATSTFSVTQAADQNAVITTYINGVLATSTAP